VKSKTCKHENGTQTAAVRKSISKHKLTKNNHVKEKIIRRRHRCCHQQKEHNTAGIHD